MNENNSVEFYTVCKAGRCWNGAHRDRGTVIHIVEGTNPEGSMRNSLCGAEPGGRSYGWSKTDRPATCQKCIKKQKNILSMKSVKNTGNHYCTNCLSQYDHIPYTCEKCGNGNFKPVECFSLNQSQSKVENSTTDLDCKELLHKLQTEPFAFVSIIISKHLNEHQKAALIRWLTPEFLVNIEKDQQTCYVSISTTEEMPPIGESVSVSFDGGVTFPYKAMGKGWKKEEVNYTHWLKRIENLAFQTPEELKKIKSESRSQQWISVNDRLPTEDDTCEDYFNKVWTLQVGRTYPTEMTYWEVKSCPFTKYWMPIPPRPFPFLPEPAKD